MSCALTQGYTLPCKDAVGGINTVYIMEFENLTSYAESSGVVTAMTITTGKKFWTYQLIKETGELSEVSNGTESGTWYEQTVTFPIHKLQASTRNELKLIAQNRLVVVVKTNDGKYWLTGSDYGMDKTGTNDAKAGKGLGDFNGYTITLVGKEKTPMLEVNSGIIATITTPAA